MRRREYHRIGVSTSDRNNRFPGRTFKAWQRGCVPERLGYRSGVGILKLWDERNQRTMEAIPPDAGTAQDDSFFAFNRQMLAWGRERRVVRPFMLVWLAALPGLIESVATAVVAALVAAAIMLWLFRPGGVADRTLGPPA